MSKYATQCYTNYLLRKMLDRDAANENEEGVELSECQMANQRFQDCRDRSVIFSNENKNRDMSSELSLNLKMRSMIVHHSSKSAFCAT